MPEILSRNDKLTLIALCKFIVNSDGNVTEAEIKSMNLIAEEIGFDDYHEIFNEADEKITSIELLKDYIEELKNSENRKKILTYAIQISKADANIQDDEIDILRFAADCWDLNIKDLINS